MGQDVLVTEELDAGRGLVNRLIADGFDVRLALWVKEVDAGRWYLYLASPVVDASGRAAAYRKLLPLVLRAPEFGIEFESIKLVGVNDSPAAEAAELIRPRVPQSPFAVPNPKPYPGLTRFGGATLAGRDVDGVYIYPPFSTA